MTQAYRPAPRRRDTRFTEWNRLSLQKRLIALKSVHFIQACQLVGTAYEDLPGQRRDSKARHLVEQAIESHRQYDLVDLIIRVDASLPNDLRHAKFDWNKRDFRDEDTDATPGEEIVMDTNGHANGYLEPLADEPAPASPPDPRTDWEAMREVIIEQVETILKDTLTDATCDRAAIRGALVMADALGFAWPETWSKFLILGGSSPIRRRG